MGWANCGTDSKGRPIGYAHGGVCDHEGCSEKIDHGLSFACGGMHGDGGGGRLGCEGYFCEKHLGYAYAYEPTDDGDEREIELTGSLVCEACQKAAIAEHAIASDIDDSVKSEVTREDDHAS